MTGESDGFAEGFNSVRDGTPTVPGTGPAAVPEAVPDPAPAPAEPAAEAEVTPAPEASDAVVPDEKAAPAAPPEPELIPGYTGKQIASLLARMGEIDTVKGSLDKLSGHVGTVLQEMKGLKAPPKAEVEVETVPLDDSEFAQTYPEFAGYLAQQLKKARPQTDDHLLAEVAKARQEFSTQLEERTINILHPDWAEQVHSEGYKLWLAVQPPEVRTTASQTQSAFELAGVLTSYKEHVKKQSVAQRNKSRLEAALAPGSVPGARPEEPTEEDAMRAAFHAVRRA